MNKREWIFHSSVKNRGIDCRSLIFPYYILHSFVFVPAYLVNWLLCGFPHKWNAKWILQVKMFLSRLDYHAWPIIVMGERRMFRTISEVNTIPGSLLLSLVWCFFRRHLPFWFQNIVAAKPTLFGFKNSWPLTNDLLRYQIRLFWVLGGGRDVYVDSGISIDHRGSAPRFSLFFGKALVLGSFLVCGCGAWQRLASFSSAFWISL